MRQSEFSEEQITSILAEYRGGSKVKDLCRKYNISDKTLMKWRVKFGNLGLDDVKRLKLLTEENSKLKRIVANLTLDKEALKEVLSKKW